MANLNVQEKLSYIKSFVSEMDDYDPMGIENVVGCFNTKYHGNLCQAVINPPVTKDSPTSYPRTIIAYILAGDEIILCDTALNGHRLIECLGYSIESVYEEIKKASEYKQMYEGNKKEGV